MKKGRCTSLRGTEEARRLDPPSREPRAYEHRLGCDTMLKGVST